MKEIVQNLIPMLLEPISISAVGEWENDFSDVSVCK